MALLTSGLLASASLIGLGATAEAAPGKGVTGKVAEAWCTPGDSTGTLGAAVRVSEKGKRGVTRMRVRWIAADASTGAVVASKTKRSAKFADTKGAHRFRSRHSFTLAEGVYELKVVMTWVRGGANWRRSLAGTCNLGTPDAPPPPPPDLPPDVPPPPTLAAEQHVTAPPAIAGRVVGTDSRAQCQSGQVTAFAPAVRTDRDEYVWWLSQVWWWNANAQGWYVDSQSDYAYAAAVNGSISFNPVMASMPPWRSYPSNVPVSQRSHSGMAPGYYYTAVNYFWTESGGWTAYYADHGQGAWYCYIG